MSCRPSSSVDGSVEAGDIMLGRGHIGHIVKMHLFFEHLILCSLAYIKQHKFIVKLKDGSTKIVNILTTVTRALMLGHNGIGYILTVHYFCENLIPLYSLA